MPAHSINPSTIIGFVGDDGHLYYVTMDYTTKNLTAGDIITTDVNSCTIGNAVSGCDVAPGFAMTVKTCYQVQNTNVGISITTMRTGGSNGSWSV